MQLPSLHILGQDAVPHLEFAASVLLHARGKLFKQIMQTVSRMFVTMLQTVIKIKSKNCWLEFSSPSTLPPLNPEGKTLEKTKETIGRLPRISL
jgi:hypothetical protein